MKERDIQTEIMFAVSRLGARIFRNQVGQYKLADGRILRSGLCVGSSDLCGWTKDGRFLAIEVKTPTGKATPEQENFIRAVLAAGGVAGICRSVEDATRLLR